MDRRTFLQKSTFSATALSLALQANASDSSKTRPNILFIMSDDHAVNAISAYGSRLANVAPTPNIDRLARDGMRLNHCFCTNSICVPSRASILTGQYSHKNGVYTLADAIDPKQPNVAKLLQRLGYQTAMIGKWHLKTEPSGFDYWNVLPGQGRYHNPVLKEMGKGKQTYEGHSTDVITDLTIDWLKERQSENPFFLMCHFKAPHEPWDNANRYDEWLKETTIPEPASLFEDKSHRSPGSREYGYTIDTMAERQQRKNYHSDGPENFEGMSDKEKRRRAYQVFLKRYLRTIKGVDDNVGRLLDFLDENGLSENTVVIYTSDQGYFLGEHNYIDKRWMYEESLQMPFFIRYPKEIQAGQSNDDIILNVDFAPLFLDYAGGKIPSCEMQGRSFRDNLRGQTPDDWRTSMYYRYWQHTNRPAHYGIRTKRYKLIFFYGMPLNMKGTSAEQTKVGWELYDLQKDPHELNNVYRDPAYQSVVKELKEELRKKKNALDDTDESYPELKALQNKTL